MIKMIWRWCRDPWKPDASLQGAAAERTQQNLGLHNALQQFGCLHTAAALSRMAEQPDTAGWTKL